MLFYLPSYLLRLLAPLFFLGPFLLPSLCAAALAINPRECLECHDDAIDPKAYAGSVHGQNSCTSCHLGITDLEAHDEGKQRGLPVRCARCHEEETADHLAGAHALAGVECTGCHQEIHSTRKWYGDKQKVVDLCAGCHDVARYAYSVHGRAVEAGNPDSAACHDCHGLHRTVPFGDPRSREVEVLHTRVCLDCHGNENLMEENGVFPLAVETYWKSYHGKTFRLGYPGEAAGCTDCHTAHGVLPANNPASTIHSKNLIGTCGQCHEKVTANFTLFHVHGDTHDRRHYPILFWTFVLMTALVVGVFAVFWVHTLLWMFRGFAENREREAALAEGRLHPVPDGHKLYRRFETRHIFLHLVVIVSFLGLSLTGLPLKFSDQPWAHAIMDFYGGVHYAGLIHRGCAILTFYYFVAALILSFDFLFLRQGLQGNWMKRLFGPESLMPNGKDIRDVRDMMRWFLFRGPKPRFERWTYWEKFDFLAVFWGMFAIGGSGLMLWFPELTARFLPGWVLNVATIVHSDEALLATGFIFTVHFFNTHGRPEKFPMDFVIFNGRITKEDMVTERAAQWERYEEEGITEQFRERKSSGILYDFFFRGFGYLAVGTGLVLAFLMLYAFVRG